jgi:hypothetical protein
VASRPALPARRPLGAPADELLVVAGTRADLGLCTPEPDHPLFDHLTLRDCTWHYHGVLTPPDGAEVLVTLPTGEALLYVDRISSGHAGDRDAGPDAPLRQPLHARRRAIPRRLPALGGGGGGSMSCGYRDFCDLHAAGVDQRRRARASAASLRCNGGLSHHAASASSAAFSSASICTSVSSTLRRARTAVPLRTAGDAGGRSGPTSNGSASEMVCHMILGPSVARRAGHSFEEEDATRQIPAADGGVTRR